MKTKKVMKRIITLVLAMALMVAPSMSVFAASGNTTKAASSKMTIILDPKERGNSSTVSINVSGLPQNAVITKMTVNTGAMTYSGGAIVCNNLTISGNGRTEQLAWSGKANQTITTSKFLAAKANGTYTLSFNATNMSTLNLGTKTYKPSITVYWDDTF